jgi:hypothetical protein
VTCTICTHRMPDSSLCGSPLFIERNSVITISATTSALITPQSSSASSMLLGLVSRGFGTSRKCKKRYRAS